MASMPYASTKCDVKRLKEAKTTSAATNPSCPPTNVNPQKRRESRQIAKQEQNETTETDMRMNAPVP